MTRFYHSVWGYNKGVDQAFLFVANDWWFDVPRLVDEHRTALYWANYPRALFTGARVYLYLATRTRAIRYEFEVTRTHVALAALDLPVDYYNRYRTTPTAPEFNFDPAELLCELRLVREFTDLAATSAHALKAAAGFRGRLTGKRQLSLVTTRYLAAQV